MGIFNEFFKKEKPVFTGISRGVGGFGFGSGGGGGTAAASPSAVSGGDISAQPGGDGYTYHVFTSSGSLVAPANVTNCELLCVGPGGGGSQGNGSSGGGGAGGVVHVTGHTLVAGTYTITIPDGGAGGPESAPSPSKGTRGDNLTMTGTGFSITALGGGGGQSWGGNDPQPAANANGGSGGGAAGNPTDVFGTGDQPSQPYTVATGTVNRYGNPGGPDGGWPAPGNYRGSGGGGAGSAGGSHDSGNPPTYGGQGGGGKAFPGFVGPNPAFSPLPATWISEVGPTGVFAGGGAGGSESGGTNTEALGGSGGGGNSGEGPPSAGSTVQSGDPGVDNTGGGGGAGWWYPGAARAGGDGGKGIVLVRYQ